MFFSYAGPKFLAGQALVAWAMRLAVGDFEPWEPLLFVAVGVYWPFQEWVLHKYVLHLRPRRFLGMQWDPLFARKHRAHHRDPWSLRDTVLPARILAVTAVLNVVLWWAVTPSIGPAFTGIGAASAMACLYEWTHFLTHTSYRPRGSYYANICARHRRHHFKNEHYWYGFTVPLVDDLLRTAPDPKGIETSPTCRTLGIAEDGDRLN